MSHQALLPPLCSYSRLVATPVGSSLPIVGVTLTIPLWWMDAWCQYLLLILQGNLPRDGIMGLDLGLLEESDAVIHTQDHLVEPQTMHRPLTSLAAVQDDLSTHHIRALTLPAQSTQPCISPPGSHF